MRKGDEQGTSNIPADYAALPNGSTGGRRGNTNPYVRVDFADDALRLRVIALAKTAEVTPGAVLEYLAVNGLAALEEKPGLLSQGKLEAEEKALLAQLDAIRAKLGKK